MSLHHLVDSSLGLLFTGMAYDLAPGGSRDTVAIGLKGERDRGYGQHESGDLARVCGRRAERGRYSTGRGDRGAGDTVTA